MKMNNFYPPGHLQYRRRSAFNVTQLAEWKKLLVKIEFNPRLQSF